MSKAAKPNIADQRAIVDRRDLAAQLDDIAEKGSIGSAARRAEVLGVFKAALQRGRDEIRRRFEGGAGARATARDTVQAQCFLIDQLIRTLYDFAFEKVYPVANPTSGEKKAIVATGGYGRGELAPQSDIDLLFLIAYKLTPTTEQVIEYILYMLWDLGLKVGHATRSVDECIRMAKADHTIRTGLLESRYLWGDQPLYAELKKRFWDAAESDAMVFVEQKLHERDERHQRLGDSRYLLEPNVKEGKGGLRDLHTLYWIAKFLYKVDDVSELVGKKVFTAEEAQRFHRAQEFLTGVRCHLHYVTGRAEDRLTFDVQPGIGKRMGYKDRAGSRGVERFMKHYFLVAKTVGDLTRIFCASLEAMHQRKPRFRFQLFSRPKQIGAFVLEGGRLNAPNEKVFRDDPVNILRLFHLAQHEELDIHPAALRFITQNIKLVDAGLRENKEANRLFLEMLCSPKDPETTLRRLNEAGVFGRFVPDFGRVVAQMQHDMYHVYTVDEHTVRAIGLLHKIDQGRLREDHPLATEIIHLVQSRQALYVAVLLHDIAKGRGGDHSVLGGEVAERLGPRFGLSAEETETVAWLVRQHLVMSNTAQKRDIDDPKTITDFAERVQSPERLRLLLILTVADMRATGPHVWNNWKAQLLRELYFRTEELLAGNPVGGRIKARVEAAKTALAEALKDWPKEEIDAHLALGYPAYWLSFDVATHARHAAQARAAEANKETLSIDVRTDTKNAVTEVTIYTPDHAGLFSQIAGAMALSNANIVDAKIFTMTNGKALDTFWVQAADGKVFDSQERIKQLKLRIEKSIAGTLRAGRELAGKESLPSRAKIFTVPPRVFIDNNASAGSTVIEINGRDRPGLLYKLTRALTELGLQIGSAKISTFGERVVDVFYVKDIFGMKVENKAKQEQIRVALLAALEEDAPAPAAAKTSAAKTPNKVAAQ